MDRTVRDALIGELEEANSVLAAMMADTSLLDVIVRIREVVSNTFLRGGKLLLAGNGGSAAEAQHMAAEYINFVTRDRSGLPAISLASDSSVLTAVSNDRDFSSVFGRQIEALAKPEDTFMAFSTSGRSKNILHAILAAKERGCTTVLFTGARVPSHCEPDFLVTVPSSSTQRVQEVHTLLGHFLASSIESDLG